MWFIKNAEGEIIYLRPNKLMIVSRKEEHDIVLRNDASISKLHASIIVRPKVNFKHNEPSSTVTVKDIGSKYGTFIIDQTKCQRKLKPGDHDLTVTDKVKFGLLHHIFTLHYVPFIVSTSTVNTDQKTELRDIINILDGVVTEKWEEYCTHLTVSNVTLTNQVVKALAFGTPIVKLEYWHAVVQSVERNEGLPDVANFIPIINEGLINKESVSLMANPERKVLFKNLTFVCFSDSQYLLESIIKYAGGRMKLFKEGMFDLKLLCSENFVLLQLANTESQPSQTLITSYDSIQQSLQKRKLRLIPESEISLAILYCSIEKYCNPKFDFKRLINFSGRNKNALSSTILAPDTEDVLPSTQRNVPAVIINDSMMSSEQTEELEPGNLKRKKLSLGRKTNADNTKESSQPTLGNKRIIERHGNFGSEESSREDALMIDETRSSVESDSNDASIRRRDFVNEFDEPVDKSKVSATHSMSRRFNLQSKLQTAKVPKENLDRNETRTKSSIRHLDDNWFSNPSTSRDTSMKTYRDVESTHNLPEIIRDTKSGILTLRKPSSSSSFNDGSNLPKRNRMEKEDMFSFVNERAAKRKKSQRENDEDDLFELLEDPNVKNLPREENIFENEVVKLKKEQIKRRRSSISSNDSSIEEEQLPIKIERPDTYSETDHAPLICCKKELDNSIDETCKSSIVSLIRKDIDLTLDNTGENLKTFVKVYRAIPMQRIKLKNMYVWKSEDETIKCESHEDELTSSEEDNDDFKFYSKEVPKKGRARK